MIRRKMVFRVEEGAHRTVSFNLAASFFLIYF